MATLSTRRIVGVISSLLLATVALTGLAGPAQAEEGFQYWNYFHLENDAWAFSGEIAAAGMAIRGKFNALAHDASPPCGRGF